MKLNALMRTLLIVALAWLLVACTSPHSLPTGATPIPTLIPATEPSRVLTVNEDTGFAIQSYPARLPSASIGAPLYETHCAGCHGPDGAGVVASARNFNDLDYMRGETPAFFYSAITEGRGSMPAFRDRLNSDERWDIVFVLWDFSTTPERLALGKSIYEANCAACHGPDGVGAVLGASDFTDLRLVGESAPRDWYLAVTQGVGSMPAWQSRLSQDERWAVIEYVRTFSYAPGFLNDGSDSSAQPATGSETSATSCESYAEQTNPYNWDDSQASAAGELIFSASCAMCHGADGASSLSGVADFTSQDYQTSLKAQPGNALCIIAEGRNSMPGWKETHTTDDLWHLITYIGTLGTN